MPGEAEHSRGYPQEQENQEQLPKGLGWLLKPAGAGEIGVYISGVEGATEFTPEMRQTLEEAMQRLQREMQDLAAKNTCGKLTNCSENRQGCPGLDDCNGNYVSCPNLTKCNKNN